MAKVRKDIVEKALKNWIALNEHASSFTEEEVLHALALERDSENPRPTFIRRLEQRLRGIKIEQLMREMTA